MKTKLSTISKIISTFLTFFLLIQLITGIFLLVPPVKQAQADGTSWYDSSWLYRKSITIDNTSGTSILTNYQVQITLNSSNFDFSKTLSDGSDIRITDSDGITIIPYFIESYDSIGETATIWVKVSSILSLSTKAIYIYYGNSSPTPFDIPPIGPFDKYTTNPVISTTQLLAENIVYDDSTGKYWMVFSNCNR
jgi:hypothetical protein